MNRKIVAIGLALSIVLVAGSVPTVAAAEGVVLSDSIAPGVDRTAASFGTATVTVPPGAYVTYLVRTDVSLAGQAVEIWTTTAGGAWHLTSTRLVGSDGIARYFARVSAWTGFWAKYPGDAGHSAAVSHGRAAGASATGASAVSLACDDFTSVGTGGTGQLAATVPVRVGSRLTVTLCANASTGFAWEAPTFDRSLLRLTSHRAAPPTTALPGAAGSDRWTFTVLRTGTTTLRFAYSRPWAGGEKGIWTVTLTIRSIA